MATEYVGDDFMIVAAQERERNPSPYRALDLPSEVVSVEEVRHLVENVARKMLDRERIPEKDLLAAFSHTDLTTLLPTDTPIKIGELTERILKLQSIVPELPSLAGLCVPGDTVETAARMLQRNETQVATVVNYPLGQSPLSAVLEESRVQLERGARELDPVFPLARFLARERPDELRAFILEIKRLAGAFQSPIKTIIQSDEIEAGIPLYSEEALRQVEQLASLAYACCSDMVKTSTGKGSGGASLQATAVLSLVARNYRDNSDYVDVVGHLPGIKVSGKVGDGATAAAHRAIYQEVMGLHDEEVTKDLFRIGASGLLGSLLEALRQQDGAIGRKLVEEEVGKDYFTVTNSSPNY